MAQNSLRQGGTLHAGNFLRSNSNFHLVMQHDGNLVLYRSNDFQPHNAAWSTNTHGRGAGCRFVMQDDGNAVVYDPHNHPTWASNTCNKGHGPFELVLDEQGYVVLYDGSGTRTWANNEAAPRQRPQAFGQTPYGQPPFGQPQGGIPFGAPPPFAPQQPPYGQPAAAPYGQPASPPYGQQQPFGQVPYGQQQTPYGQQQTPYGQQQQTPYGQPSYGSGPANELAGRKFGIRTHNGHFLQAVDGGNVGARHAINAQPQYVSTWETFEAVKVDDHHVALRTLNGTFVNAQGGGGNEVHSNGQRIDAWEKFKVESLGGGRYAFRAGSGHYLCAENGGGSEVVCNRGSLGEWETFTVQFQ